MSTSEETKKKDLSFDEKMLLIQHVLAITVIPRDSVNPFYNSKYTNLLTLYNIVKPVLHDHGLYVVHTGIDIDGVSYLRTAIVDMSEKSVVCDIRLPDTNDPQKMGAAITYAKRYGLSALLAIETEEDDDANKAVEPPKQHEITREQYQPSESSTKNVGNPQRSTLPVWAVGHEGDLCPSCGSGTLRQREGKFGLFLGCDNYPTCKYILKKDAV